MSSKDTIKFHKFHDGQLAISRNLARFNIIRAGRRLGKTTMLEDIGAGRAIKKQKIGWFSPSYKLIIPTYRHIYDTVRPLIETASKVDGLIRLQTGGEIEFWSLDNEDAGRSRSYDLVIIDEASLKKRGMREIWEQAIKPTLLDRGGSAIMAGTPKGVDEENYFYQACNDKKEGWKEFHAPTWANPHLNAEAVSKLKEENSPLVWQQEYAAEFVNWNGVAFFDTDKLLVNGMGVAYPMNCDCVFAVIDSAMKDGSENDGTAVTYFALSKFFGHPLTILDWDIVQIKSDLLITWLPNVLKHLEVLAGMCKARNGSIGAFVEDKGSGITLNQYGARMGWPVTPIDGEITSTGKDGRAISASGPVHRGEVKISQFAYDKLTEFKSQTKNHLWSQLGNYRIGDKDAAKRSDDLTDTATYGVIIGLGGNEGF